MMEGGFLAQFAAQADDIYQNIIQHSLSGLGVSPSNRLCNQISCCSYKLKKSHWPCEDATTHVSLSKEVLWLIAPACFVLTPVPKPWRSGACLLPELQRSSSFPLAFVRQLSVLPSEPLWCIAVWSDVPLGKPILPCSFLLGSGTPLHDPPGIESSHKPVKPEKFRF